ncbi:hypothetical protein CRG98_037005 [Punica granatum]|uniref:Uncharacterized protein n=1 Tax=Punica granatum TaxID=22663 RepID=A0A2I0IF29_PUNGR|nr:hypothetical protein CRG98_037005 [Punica granatum]
MHQAIHLHHVPLWSHGPYHILRVCVDTEYTRNRSKLALTGRVQLSALTLQRLHSHLRLQLSFKLSFPVHHILNSFESMLLRLSENEMNLIKPHNRRAPPIPHEPLEPYASRLEEQPDLWAVTIGDQLRLLLQPGLRLQTLPRVLGKHELLLLCLHLGSSSPRRAQ